MCFMKRRVFVWVGEEEVVLFAIWGGGVGVGYGPVVKQTTR